MDKRYKFVIRTVREGTVLINGKVFKPDPRWLPYDGRLDGTRWAFGLYWLNDELEPYITLWGTEERYKACGLPYEENQAWFKKHDPRAEPDYASGGYPWLFWGTGAEYDRMVKQKEKIINGQHS